MQQPFIIPFAELRTQIQTVLEKRFTEQEELQTVCWRLLTFVTRKSRATLLAHEMVELNQAELDMLKSCLETIVVHKIPIAYLERFVPFIDIHVPVMPPILIPRPETEEWTAALIETLRPFADMPLRIVDLCTGTGAIGLALAHALPRATVYAVDNNKHAIKLCTAGTILNEIENVVTLISNIAKPLPLPAQSFDLVVSNPPYLSREEWDALDLSIKKWEDPSAFIAPENGLGFIRRIAHIAHTLLKSDSVLLQQGLPQVYCEIGYKQGASAQECFKQAGWSTVTVKKDAAGHDRLIMAGGSHEAGAHHSHT